MNKNIVSANWPELNFAELQDTLLTIQLWTQIAGKIRLSQMPWLNHSWHVTLYVSPRGLTTGSIPYSEGIFDLTFNFINHHLIISTSTGGQSSISLRPGAIAVFYKELFAELHNLGVEAAIVPVPNEVEPAVPFLKDNSERVYHEQAAHNFWQALTKIEPVFTRFRSAFTGKCSPVHFFWGGFDLAVTRFSGRKAPLYSGAVSNIPLRVMQEAYSHEVSSCGFWPGGEAHPAPAFYSYCYPTPEQFSNQRVWPREAHYHKQLGEFLLDYDIVRQSANPEETLLQFLSSTYVAAADTGNWDRQALECDLTSFEK